MCLSNVPLTCVLGGGTQGFVPTPILSFLDPPVFVDGLTGTNTIWPMVQGVEVLN